MTHEAVRYGTYFAAAARVRAALPTDAERSTARRFDAAVRACFASNFFEAAAWLSRFTALQVIAIGEARSELKGTHDFAG